MHNWESFNAPTTYANSLKFTANDVKNAVTTDMTLCRDYGFSFSSTKRKYEVFKFTVTDRDERDPYELSIYANDPFGMEVWTKQQSNGILTFQEEYTGRTGSTGFTRIMNFKNPVTGKDENFVEGDEVYILIYFEGTFSNANGLVSLQDLAEDDDVTGSAYEAYEQWKNGNYTQYEEWTLFNTTDDRDADVFMLDCGTSSLRNHIKVKGVNDFYANKFNCAKTQQDKYVELASKRATDEIMCTHTSPDDITTMPLDSSVSLNVTSYKNQEKFVYVYNVPGTKKVYRDQYLVMRYN